jgi:hypothetical protein
MSLFGMASETGPRGVRLYRVAPGATTHLVCLCRSWELAALHWVGRSVLCAGEDCPLCCEGTARTVGFLVVGSPQDAGLLQLSMSALERLSASAVDFDGGGIERLDFLLTLPKVRSTHCVKVLGRWSGESDGVWSMSALRASVCVLHGVPCSHVDFPGGEAAPHVLDRVRARAKLFAANASAGAYS